VRIRRGPAAVYLTSPPYHRKFREGAGEDEGSQKTLEGTFRCDACEGSGRLP